MMLHVDTSMHPKYITYSQNGIPVLYVRLSKALYRILRADLLFYMKLSSDLEDMGL
jgi:hypothetical protein